MRFGWNICIIVSLLLLPWWLTVLFIISAFFLVRHFYEGMFYGVLLDALYGTSFGFHGFEYVFTASAVAIFFTSSVIREKVMW